MEPLFRLEGVVVAEADGRRRIDGLSATIESGERLAVLGPSGAGKSTLLFLLNRLLDPTAGSIFFRGRPLQAYDPRELRRSVVLVPQRATAVSGTVADNVCLGRRIHRLPCPREAVAEMLAAFGLGAGLIDRDARALSGGELARVALARAVMLAPEVLLLDEVTASLDPPSAEGVLRVLFAGLSARGEGERTVVWVTHDWALARRFSSRMWWLERGRLIRPPEGAPREGADEAGAEGETRGAAAGEGGPRR
ncbi:MAG: ABC transporter ATP-binding protein [Hydrogenibacillus schlegelii]|nr:ABC transporter ATP-binding protein [Hydrogenibacillus schlegelii]